MLDTCIVFDMLTNFDGLDKYTIHLLEDPNCTLYTSFETMRELVVLFNNKKIGSKQWKTAEDVLQTVLKDLNIKVLPLREEVSLTYSRLQINEAKHHYDPSDHIIISHAITEHIKLISSDKKFTINRSQGLDLIEC